jgi:sugar lactone lactonase YvrE
LPGPSGVETITLGGDWVQVARQFNANGIDATPDGRTLIVVNSTLGNLYTVDPQTGEATQIDLGSSAAVTNGDGILLDGKTLYVVRNRFNMIAVAELDARLATGSISGTITDPNFDVPTTITEHGSRLYAVNARFTTPPGPAWSMT